MTKTQDSSRPSSSRRSSAPNNSARNRRTRPKRVSFNSTDAGNAELFCAMYKNELRFDHSRKRWLIWNEHRWIEDKVESIILCAKEVARWRRATAKSIQDPHDLKAQLGWARASEMGSRIEAMLKLAQSEHPLSDAGTEWDSNPMLFGVANGVVDLRTGRLRAGQRTDKITLCTDLTFDAGAECPRFHQFLNQIFREDQELIEFVHRAIGYSMTGATTEQVLFLCYGLGANGKSTFLNVIRRVFGEYAHTLPFSSFELRSRSEIPHDIAGLVARRFVTAQETSESARLNEARLKALTGCDPMSARFLYKPLFTFVPVAKIWLAFNHKPGVSDDSEGFWRRIRLIPFEQTFSRDDKLEEKLKAEAPGILNWAVRGCLEWQKKGLGFPKRVQEASQAYREENDPLKDFLQEKCVLTASSSAAAGAVWNAYQSWTATNDEHPISRKLFSARLKARGLQIQPVGHAKTWTWFGIGLREQSLLPTSLRADADVKSPLLEEEANIM